MNIPHNMTYVWKIIYKKSTPKDVETSCPETNYIYRSSEVPQSEFLLDI